MKIPKELRLFLNELAEQLKMDSKALELAEKLVKEQHPHTADMFATVREAADGKMTRIYEQLD